MSDEAVNKLVDKSLKDMDTDGNKKITQNDMKQFYIERMRNIILLKEQISIYDIVNLVQSNSAEEVS